MIKKTKAIILAYSELDDTFECIIQPVELDAFKARLPASLTPWDSCDNPAKLVGKSFEMKTTSRKFGAYVKVGKIKTITLKSVTNGETASDDVFNFEVVRTNGTIFEKSYRRHLLYTYASKARKSGSSDAVSQWALQNTGRNNRNKIIVGASVTVD